MPRRARRASASGIHHVMLRGVNRDMIFLEDEDRERFLTALRTARDVSGFSILAYCLMDNHVHLAMQEGPEPVGAAVRRVGVRYAGWFNRKYQRVGHLFQDRFKSVPVEADAHLVTLLRYVWNNPVEAGLANDPDEYRWSSRHLHGRRLVDLELLHRLVPTDPLAIDHPRPGQLWDTPGRTGPRSRYSDEEVAILVEQVSGAGSAAEFLALDAQARRRAVHALRMRSVPFAQLARHTGLSSTTLKRIQADGGPSAAP